MTDDERIIREALAAGPTPGPWNPMPAYAVEKCVARISKTEVVPPSGVDLAHESVDAHYVAACSPDRITRLLAEVERLRAELAEARRDAERYRFIREGDKAWRIGITHYFDPDAMDEHIDAAIDRARGAG